MPTFPCPNCGKTLNRQGGYRHVRTCNGQPPVSLPSHAKRARATQTAPAVSLATSPAPSTAPHPSLADAIVRLLTDAVDLGHALGEILSAQLVDTMARGLATTDITALAIARIEAELADPATFDGRKPWLRDQLRVLKDKLAARQAAAAKEK